MLSARGQSRIPNTTIFRENTFAPYGAYGNIFAVLVENDLVSRFDTQRMPDFARYGNLSFAGYLSFS
jgi:hypothetical protein